MPGGGHCRKSRCLLFGDYTWEAKAMAKTIVHLYRSVMGDKFKKIKLGVYPGDSILDPQWEDEQIFSKKLNRNVRRAADVVVVPTKNGPEVEPGGGTSLHDVARWFPSKEFWIPAGTIYSDEIHIKKDGNPRKNPGDTVVGTHYQLEARTQMAVVAFQGALNNMARAAVVRQVELAKVGV